MKTILMAAVALTALTATPALAQEAKYTVTGNVDAVCAATATGTIGFAGLTDSSGTLNATTKEATDSTAYCNGAATTVTVAHENLKHKTFEGTPAAGFVKEVAFTPVIVAGSGASQVTLTGDKAAGTAIGAFSGLTIKASNPTVTSGTKPLAGEYQGSITVTLAPAH